MFPPYFYFRFSKNWPFSVVFHQLCTALAPHLAVIQFCVTGNLGDGQWTAARRAASLRNTLWHDNFGRSRIELAIVAHKLTHAAPIFRALLGRCDASHAPPSTLITPSVEEFNYTTLSIVETATNSGRGRAYWIFILWTGKIEFRLTSNISAAEQATAKKIAAQKLMEELHTTVDFAPPAVHRSAARGPKRKTFPPKFLENG